MGTENQIRLSEMMKERMEICSFYYDKDLICHIKINSVLQSKTDKKYRMEDNDGILRTIHTGTAKYTL